MVAHPIDDVTPHLQCALSLLSLPVLRRLGLLRSGVGGDDVCQGIGVCRSASYGLAGRVMQATRDVHRPQGRPPKPQATTTSTAAHLQIGQKVIGFLMDNPGCVVPGQRRVYSDGFRRFVVGLVAPGQPGETVSLADIAATIQVPVRTLRDWLATPTDADDTAGSGDGGQDEPAPASAEPAGDPHDPNQPTESRPLPPELEQIVTLWKRWKGGFCAFVRSLEQHRIFTTPRQVRQILDDFADRTPARRGRRQGDCEAGRGSLETFYPNAQLFADGKQVDVSINGTTFTFCWQTVVDGHTCTPTGVAVRDAEDGAGLVEALAMSKRTTGQAPDALTRDAKPCNYAPEVEAVVQKDDIISVPATVNRPENKAPVEGLFGLFSQYLPPIRLQADNLKQLARQILTTVLVAYCVGRGRAPRAALGGRSPLQAFEQDRPTDEQRREARKRLSEIRNRILDQQAAERRRADPVCRAELQQAFVEFGLSDPAGTLIPTTARYGLDAVLEAIAVFRHKRDTGRLPDHHHERYLLGIARNIAERNEDLAVYQQTVQLRLEARDTLLQPLRQQAQRLAANLDRDDYIDTCLQQALDARFHIDRQWWTDTCMEAFETLPEAVRRLRGPNMARRIATQYNLPRQHRDNLMAALVRATTGRLAAA